jgi:hypothetical protein
MRAASFRIQDSAGKQADLGVVPLPGLMGRDLETVNRWRTTVGLPEVKEEELAKLAEKVEIAGLTADLYDQGGENPGSGEKARILAAILRKDNVAWFFKMAGDDQLVAKEKPAFISFLKSVSFTASAAPMPAPNMSSSALPASHPPIDGVGSAPPTAAAQNRPAWEVPAGWKEAPAGQFLVAKYLVAEGTNAQAAVNVSMSSGTGGGVAGNVNRWRGQLGLGELPEAEVSKLVSPLEGSAGAVSVDLAGSDPRTGGKTRLVAAIIPRGDVTWFYKLMGNEQLVQREKDAFLSFVRSAKYN